MTGHRDECAADRACVVGPIAQHCYHHECTMGGPVTCLACADFAERRGLAPRYCELRAAGDERGACEMILPDQPERCAGK